MKTLIRSVVKTISLLCLACPLMACAASFDCGKATTNTEKMICADENLSKLDGDLAQVYKATMEKIADKEALKQEQKTWLKIRNACADTLCLTKMYQTQIDSLSKKTANFTVTPSPENRATVLGSYGSNIDTGAIVYGGLREITAAGYSNKPAEPRDKLAQSCSGIRDEYDQAYCYNKIYSSVDEELNKEYQMLIELLTKPQRKTLRKLQLKWMEDRNSTCSLKANQKFYIDMKCATEITVTQKAFLKNQVALCKSGKCGINPDDEKPEVIPKGKYKASYYNGKQFIASELVDIISINYPYSEFRGIPSSSFHAIWEGDVESDVEGKIIVLSVSVSWSDVSIFVDDELITNWSNSDKELPITLAKGNHRIKVEYFNHWHTVNFTASFTNYPKINISDATAQISPLVTRRTKTVYVGAYESKNLHNQVVIKILKNKSPIILFLSSYDVVNWSIENPTKSPIAGIFFSSYNLGSSVVISNEKTKIFNLMGLVYAYKDFVEASAQIQRLTGVIPSYKYGEYGLSQVEIPSL